MVPPAGSAPGRAAHRGPVAPGALVTRYRASPVTARERPSRRRARAARTIPRSLRGRPVATLPGPRREGASVARPDRRSGRDLRSTGRAVGRDRTSPSVRMTDDRPRRRRGSTTPADRSATGTRRSPAATLTTSPGPSHVRRHSKIRVAPMSHHTRPGSAGGLAPDVRQSTQARDDPGKRAVKTSG